MPKPKHCHLLLYSTEEKGLLMKMGRWGLSHKKPDFFLLSSGKKGLDSREQASSDAHWLITHTRYRRTY